MPPQEGFRNDEIDLLLASIDGAKRNSSCVEIQKL